VKILKAKHGIQEGEKKEEEKSQSASNQKKLSCTCRPLMEVLP
jgi:hypothetical protein